MWIVRMRIRVTGRHEHVETVVAVYHERHESRIEVQRMQAHRGGPPRKHARPMAHAV